MLFIGKKNASATQIWAVFDNKMDIYRVLASLSHAKLLKSSQF